VNKKKFLLTFKLFISSLFVGYLAFKLDWTEISDAFKEAHFIYYIGSTLLLLILVILNSLKFYLFIKDTPIHKSISFLTKVNFISRFYALFLPSAISRGAVRWYKVTESQKERTFFLAVIFFERFVHIFLLLIFGFIPLFIYSSNSKIIHLRSSIWPIVLTFYIVTIIGMGYFLLPEVKSYLKNALLRILPAHERWEKILIFYEKLNIPNLSVSLFISILLISFLWILVFAGRIFLLSKALGLPLEYIDIAWMSSLVLLLQLIPVSFAGIGVREGAYAYLITVFGLSPVKGVSIGVLFFSQMLIVAAIGGIFEIFEK